MIEGFTFYAVEEDGPTPLRLPDSMRVWSDVYDAVEWSAIIELSHRSVAEGFTPVRFPDFRTR